MNIRRARGYISFFFFAALVRLFLPRIPSFFFLALALSIPSLSPPPTYNSTLSSNLPPSTFKQEVCTFLCSLTLPLSFLLLRPSAEAFIEPQHISTVASNFLQSLHHTLFYPLMHAAISLPPPPVRSSTAQLSAP